MQPGPYVLLMVSDTGCGMDSETQSHIFEPFYTTKPEGVGTGLGLSTVFGIIKQSEGFISVYSEVDRGTTFKIYLPEVDGPAPAAEEECEILESRRDACEMILLVEDEARVRNVAKRILEWSGYSILEAGNGEDALKLAQEHAGEIDLLLTDVVMPGMSGPQLAAQLCTAHPGLRVIYMSGYTDDAVVRHGLREATAHFIQKPCAAAQLTSKIRQVLDRPYSPMVANLLPIDPLLSVPAPTVRQ